MIALDFETLPITREEMYPKPVGVALLSPTAPKGYYVRGTPSQQHDAIMRELKRHKTCEVVMHGGVGFDLGVARKWLKIELPIERVHDTLVLAFLDDPYRRLALKPLASRLLGIAPDEQHDLRAWILKNVPEARRSPQKWGAWIAQAPGYLVEPYAIGDVVRTAKLFKLLSRNVKRDGMWPAYRREIEATPILLENELRGIPLDRPRLVRDLATFEELLERTDERLCKLLHSKNLLIDSGEDVAAHIERLHDIALPKTAKGSVKTDVATIAAVLPPGELRSTLLYRSALAYDVRTFMSPWASISRADGRLRTHWNLVGGTGRVGGGTRTGRLSSEPNMQNLTSTEKREQLLKSLGKAPRWLSEWSLPVLRSYIIPEKGEVLIGRDYSQQELRLMAHFENDLICAMYNRNPSLDVHQMVGDMIKAVTGFELSRKIIKVLNFCTLYGGGAPAIARRGGMSLDEARRVRDLYFTSMPTIKGLILDTQAEARSGYIETIGGRIYEVENGVDDEGFVRDLAYKLVNYMIQGSAADQMKEALRQLFIQRKTLLGASFKLTVHDELLFSAPKKAAREALRRIDRIMVDTAKTFKLRVPFLTDGYMGPNWALVKKEKGL